MERKTRGQTLDKETTMTRSTTTTAAAGLALAASLGLGAAAPPAYAHGNRHPDTPEVPAGLEVPEGNRPFLISHGVGTQNYICLVAGQPWTFLGPQATLFDHRGKQALTHFLSVNPFEPGVARATWQDSRDTSAVWALAIASSSDPAYVEPGAVAWLLLRVVGAQAGWPGPSKVAQTTFIQRVNTVGGSAPSATCPAAGTRAFVPYETDYVFYRAR
jgi:hypothetical protein